ncbi:lactosylceramide 1,3-N-acetyl-beta-D-glucosaminyltransferase isoform X2 [Cervus elaphus]|uniref:lactosylceramide 1,3-N-acetyl-beta-D-glucosaminyltransferase isoform X2 n=1 Tax=Cervus elaphus TaxID=9860 RepID=UPI001CC2948E|nr:lactosylceramide 1,3-N-acetyl-beta-D-glucosaminyltransferase isoform X2 [Cervus elaphus]
MGKVPARSAGINRTSSSGLFFVRGDGFPWSAARAPGRPGLRPAPARPGRLAAPPSRSGSRAAGKESVLLPLDQARSPGLRGEESRSQGGSRTSDWNDLWGRGSEAVADPGLGAGSRPWSGARAAGRREAGAALSAAGQGCPPPESAAEKEARSLPGRLCSFGPAGGRLATAILGRAAVQMQQIPGCTGTFFFYSVSGSTLETSLKPSQHPACGLPHSCT